MGATSHAPTPSHHPSATASAGSPPAAGSATGPSTAYRSGAISGYPATPAASHRLRTASTVQRAAVDRFRLERRVRVRVLVWQESPACRMVGRYAFAGAPGSNVLHLPRRVGTHRITSGTYRIVGVALHTQVIDVRIRVVRDRRRLRIFHSHLVNTCTETVEAAGLDGAGLGTGAGASTAGGGQTVAAAGGGSHGRGSGDVPTTAAGAPMRPPLQALRTLPRAASERTLLFVLVVIAIALLGAGALPSSQDGTGTGAILTRHRAALTAGGLAMIAAALLASILG